MHLRARLVFIAGLIAASANPASLRAADDISGMRLEDLLRVEVQGASRYAQPLAEAPSAVTLIPAADIRRFGFRDIGEALQSAPGVYTSQDRAYSYLGVRGFSRPGDYNTRILLLVDGARNNDPLFDQALIGNEAPIDIDWIKRLEFVPGPGSASYGGNALFGIANAVLWSGADLDGTRVSFDASSGAGRRASLLSGGRTAAGLDWVAGISAYERRGENLYFAEFDRPGISDGVAHHRDGERYVKAMLKLTWENWRGTVTASQRTKDVPTAYFNTVFDAPGNFARDRSFQVDVARTSTLAPFLDQQLRLHYGHYEYDADYPFVGVVNRDLTRADWWNAEWQLAWTGWSGHRLLGGIELRNQPRLLQRNYNVSPARRQPQRAQCRPRCRNLRAGRMAHRARLADQHRREGRHQRGRQSGYVAACGADLAPARRTDRKTDERPRLSRRQRIRTPLRRQREPEGQSRFARGARHHPRSLGGIHADGDPALRTGLLSIQGARPDRAGNRSGRRTAGLSQSRQALRARLGVRCRNALFGGGWRMRGSLAWQSISQPGGEVINSPRRLGKLLLDGPLPALGATLGLNLQAMSSRRTLLAKVDGHVTGNLVLRQAERRGHGLWSLGIYNLADRHYRDPVGTELAPIDALERDDRQWRLGWELEL
jgi:outer membrane receptor protein involved in Fe transport